MFVDKCKGRSVRDRDNFVDNLGADLPGRLMYSICYSIFLYAISHISILHRSWLSLLTTGGRLAWQTNVLWRCSRETCRQRCKSQSFSSFSPFQTFSLPLLILFWGVVEAFTKTNISKLSLFYVWLTIIIIILGERPAVEDEHH